MSQIIEIHDPALDQEAIRQQIEIQVAERRAANAYDPDLTQKGPVSLQPRAALLGAETPNTPNWNDILVTLMLHHHLSEPGFSSNTPVVGTLIVAMRRFWNWMSTKWYLRPILKQQNNINTQLVLIITELTQRNDILSQKLAELETEVQRLKPNLAEKDIR